MTFFDRILPCHTETNVKLLFSPTTEWVRSSLALQWKCLDCLGPRSDAIGIVSRSARWRENWCAQPPGCRSGPIMDCRDFRAPERSLFRDGRDTMRQFRLD